MIVAELSHMRGQIASTPNMQKALAFLGQVQGADLADGRVEIDGDKVFALVQSYETATPGEPVVFEVHRQYIDVQYVVSGEELVAWASTDHLPVTREYDAAKEAWFGAVAAADVTFVRLAAGELGVFYP